MEQRHMQEKSRGAARPDVDARARAIQEQIIHIPRPAQPGNARPAAQSTAGHPSGAQQRPPQAARPRDDACAQRRRAAPAPAHTAPRGQAAGGRHYAAKPRKRRRAPGGGMFFACVAVVILSLSWVITTLIELPAKRAAASSCFVGFSGCFLSGRRQRGADRGSGAWPCTANRRFVYAAFRFTGGAAGGGPCGYELL